MSDEDTPAVRQLNHVATENSRILGGMFGAQLHAGAIAFLALPIMAVFGKGDYIIAIYSLLYMGLFVYGMRVRRSAQKGTAKRSLGLWISTISLILAVAFAATAIAFLLEPSGWRYKG